MTYIIQNDYISHHGILGMKWGVRRFQPYPSDYNGDGKYVGKKVRKQERLERKASKKRELADKNLKIGSDRLNNRIKRANALADVDRLSKKIGWSSTKKASEAHREVRHIKAVSKEILENEDRTRALGNYTRKVRNLTVGLTSTASLGAYTSGIVVLSTLMSSPVAALGISSVGAAAIAKVGYDYYQKTKY